MLPLSAPTWCLITSYICHLPWLYSWHWWLMPHATACLAPALNPGSGIRGSGKQEASGPRSGPRRVHVHFVAWWLWAICQLLALGFRFRVSGIRFQDHSSMFSSRNANAHMFRVLSTRLGLDYEFSSMAHGQIAVCLQFTMVWGLGWGLGFHGLSGIN